MGGAARAARRARKSVGRVAARVARCARKSVGRVACPTQSEHEVFDGDDEGQSGLVYTNGQPDHVATMLVEAGFPQNRIDDLYEAIQFYYNEVEDQNKAVELFKEFNHLVYNSARKSELFTENELDAIKKAARRRAPHGG